MQRGSTSTGPAPRSSFPRRSRRSASVSTGTSSSSSSARGPAIRPRSTRCCAPMCSTNAAGRADASATPGLPELLLYQPAHLAEVQAAGVARFQRGHHLAHILGAGGAGRLDGGGDGGPGLGLAHLSGEELLDDGDLGGLLGGLLFAPGLLVDGERLAPLLDHPLQQRRYLLIGDGGLGGDVALLQGGADQAQRGKARLVVRLERSLGLGHQTVAHGG